MSSLPKNFNWFAIFKSIAGLFLFLAIASVALQKWGVNSNFLPPPLLVTAKTRTPATDQPPTSVARSLAIPKTKSGQEIKTFQTPTAPENFPDELDDLSGQTANSAAETRQLIVRRWADKNPAAAAAWLGHESPLNEVLLQQVAIAWAGHDLSAAVEWARNLPVGDEKHAATLALAYEAARPEPITALELARTLPVTDGRDQLLMHAVSQWAVTDSVAATGWAGKVSEPQLRENLLAAVAVAVAKRNGRTAATLAATTLPAGDLQNRTAVAIAQRWEQSEPSAAAAWVSQFPAGPARTAANENLQASKATPIQTALTTPQ